MNNDDFFGVEYISKEPIPNHMLPKSALSNAVENRKTKKDGNSYIDSTFFHGLDEPTDGIDDRSFNKNKNEDFFTEHFYEKKFLFYNNKLMHFVYYF